MRLRSPCDHLRNYASRDAPQHADCDGILGKMRRQRIYHMWPRGGLGNQMIEYMAALSIRENVDSVEISNLEMPQWNISHPYLPSGRVHALPENDLIGLDVVHEKFNAGFDCLSYSGYAQHTKNFLPKAYYDKIFRSGPGYKGWSSEYLVINIRGAEILDARHSAYGLIPIAFYKAIIEITGLKPVFMGQIESNIYMDEVRAAFPYATFVPSLGPMGDFETLRRSQHVMPSISTFSWLACWLSDAKVYFPIYGLFNPFQEIGKRFVPHEDERYSLYQFPIYYADPVASYAVGHKDIEDSWFQTSPDMFETCFAQFPRFPVTLDMMLRIFDPEYYLAANPDVREHYGSDHSSAISHFHDCGFYENRNPLAFDDRFYVATYPLAAREIGSGDFRGPLHHFANVGVLRGYLPRAY